MLEPYFRQTTFSWPHGLGGREPAKDRKPGDFGLRGFYPQDAKGQYDMQARLGMECDEGDETASK